MRGVLAGVLCCCSALPAAASDGPGEVSQPPASTSGDRPVMLGEIFERQLGLLDTLQQQLDALKLHNSELAKELIASQAGLQASAETLARLRAQIATLNESLQESEAASQSLQASLRSSGDSLSGAQSSLRRVERDRWVMAAAALAAGAILGGLLL